MPHEPLRIALIGAGMVSEAHARSVSQLASARLVAVYSRTPARATALADAFGAEATTDLAAVLARDDVDAVIVTTAPHNHAPHAVAAMNAGKHVLVEKPMAIAPAECDRIIATIVATGRTYGVIAQNRFKKAVRHARQFIASGRLGAVLHISGYVKWHRPQRYYEANDWRGRRALEGGGVIFSQAGHTLDLMQWLGGPVAWVFTNMVTAPVHDGIDIEDLGTVSLRFASGATGVLEASTALYPGAAERLELHGTRGTIALEAGAIAGWQIAEAGADDAPPDEHEDTGTGAADPMAFPITWHRAQIADFVEAVAASRPPTVDAREGRALVDLCAAIYRSARELTVVHL